MLLIVMIQIRCYASLGEIHDSYSAVMTIANDDNGVRRQSLEESAPCKMTSR